MSLFSRRRALRLGVDTTLGYVALGAFGGQSLFAQGDEPHFFINVCVAGGVDPTYWFDARPNDMTDGGLVSNYLYKTADAPGDDAAGKRIEYIGKNGGRCLRTTLTEPLMKFRDEMTVINGIVMNGVGIAGHGQNMYTLYTGKNVGGYNSWVPMIGAKNKSPIESVHVGGWKGDGNQAPKNFGGSVQLDGFSSMKLFEDIKESAVFDMADPTAKFLLDRYAARAGLGDAFALGSQAVADGLTNAPRLNASLIEAANAGGNTSQNGALANATVMTHRLFAGNVTSSVTIMMDRDMGSSFDIDSHSGSIARNLPVNYAEIIKDIIGLIDYLKANEYKNGKSLLDVTTVMVSSEFGRPYRQVGMPIWTTGTDHNQLINSMLLFGKGIQGGNVIGASDMETLDAIKPENVSGAHKACEPMSAQGGACIMPMGRPFDFETGQATAAKPETFKLTDYLSINSVTNTLLRQFGYTDDKLFRDPDGKQLPTIEKHLLKNV